MNKNITRVLTLISCLLFLPIAAVARITIDGINYEFNGRGGTVFVDKSPNCTGDIVILSSITDDEGRTFPVTRIGPGAFSGCSITSVTIPGSVTRIDDSAFKYCRSLTSVTIPNSVTNIGRNAFADCSSLASVTIPNSVTSISEDAFSGCSSLASVIIPNSVISIDREAFSGCSSLTSVTIPTSVTSISVGAFYGCSSLTSVTIPNSVTSIREGVFSGCSSLTSVTIPNSVTSIREGVFSGCSSLASVTIPNSVTSIDKEAFFGCSSLTSVTIPNSVTSIGINAFYGCSSLTSVTIPNSVTSIGPCAFSDCFDINRVNIKDLAAWCNIDFHGCGSNPLYNGASLYLNGIEIKDLVIPSSVSEIKGYTFAGYNDLTSITIPNSVTSIGIDAFYDCFDINRVNIEDLAAWCNINFSGFASNPACQNVVFYLNGKEVTDLVIPSSVTEIKQYAFVCCDGFTSVTIPNSVTSIGCMAFYKCSSLTSVTIPNSVTSIGDEAFWKCSSLASVTIPCSVTLIGCGAFEECSSLTSVTIPCSVTLIGNRAFYKCSSLTSVTIPTSVKNLCGYTFSECSSLKSIYSLNVIPPICEDYVFTYINQSATLYVPKKSMGTYRVVDGWNKIPNIDALKKSYTFIYIYEGQQLNYTVLDVDDMACKVEAGNKVEGSVVIPEEAEGCPVTTIGENAFSHSDAMTSITIFSTIKAVESHAFESCTGLKSVYSLNMIPPTCAGDAFSGFNKSATLYVPGKAIEAYRAADGWKEFQNIEALKKDYTFMYTYEGKRLQYAVWDEDENTCKVANDNNASGKVIIPAEAEGYTVTVVGDSAFCDNEAMTDVNIPKSVKIIGKNSFYGCKGLTSVTIPESVTEIGSRAFNNCASLNTVVISSSVEKIGDYAFGNSRKLKSIYSMSLTPPELSSKSCFVITTIRSATLYVPNEAVEAYKSAEGWKDFQNIVGIDPTGIEDVKVTGESRKKENVIYDLSGRRLNQPKRGINIVNGKKVMVNL